MIFIKNSSQSDFVGVLYYTIKKIAKYSVILFDKKNEKRLN
ncbi:hypothetical protein CLONEX_01559 [[Clostridium] nexile DSM 1787]|nr:hypothetical protein CLONEX_01559 [[Clostridium] nexile DSM 1787]